MLYVELCYEMSRPFLESKKELKTLYHFISTNLEKFEEDSHSMV